MVPQHAEAQHRLSTRLRLASRWRAARAGVRGTSERRLAAGNRGDAVRAEWTGRRGDDPGAGTGARSDRHGGHAADGLVGLLRAGSAAGDKPRATVALSSFRNWNGPSQEGAQGVGVAQGVAGRVVVEVGVDGAALGGPFVNAVCPPVQVVVRVGAAVELVG